MGDNESAKPFKITDFDNGEMTFIFHPLQALIASATDRELAKYIQFLKEENKILRARVPGQIHTRPDERERLIKFGKGLGRLRFVITSRGFINVVFSRNRGPLTEDDCPTTG